MDKPVTGSPPEAQSRAEKIVEFKRQKTLLKTGACKTQSSTAPTSPALPPMKRA
jgi:hypothetical protein